MSLEYRTNIEPKGNLAIWKIEEEETFFLEQLHLSPEEQQQLDQIRGKRRLEWLASRHLVHLLSERESRGTILKNEYGKPFLQHSVWHISMSHTLDYAAVIAAPFDVGVDIQRIVQSIERIRHKFMNQDEIELLRHDDNDLYRMHVIWGIKESMFKIYGKGALNWCENFRVSSFEYNQHGGHVNCMMYDQQHEYRYVGFYQMFKETMMVYVKPELIEF
jgi:4'-phosphopantetheinyl transferase